MKLTAHLLALIFSAATLFGQETSSQASGDRALLAQAAAPSKQDNAITAINDRGATDRSAPAPAADTTTIPAPRTTPSNSAPEPSNGLTTMTLWKLIQDGGWAMVPLGFLSVVTV